MNMKKFLCIGVVLLIAATAVYAQDFSSPSLSGPIEVSDGELRQFVTALQDVEAVQQVVQSEMIAALDDHEISVERFNELYQAQHDPSFDITTPASQEEQDRFALAERDLQGIQQEGQAEMLSAVAEGGLDVERFNQIYVALTQDPNLQQRIQRMLQ
ncbi:MAG: DUF4168 domain-containing protein [Spirochaetaceae bacterium]|nr:MAG: DUF4168 domain-containing protein [Spirochaetaceae bacterium]